ncbi:MAG: DegT/DnrJ/EryC1/StrS aminotransferase family protein [Actinobacteria bacterium]|nr:DegT/DnrJ/EryC1/StrS aminotransferase family protein [Actinomycetota bacterium]
MTQAYAPWPVYDEEQIEAVSRVLRSGKVNYWTGTEGRAFEREFAEFTGTEHAVFVANGTLALELAIQALELPAGSEVITTPRTYIASSSAIVRSGLRPIFVDVDLDSGSITAETIEAAITSRTSAVLVVHLGGWPADMPAIRDVCDRHGLRLIEDCSQAHGAMIGDRHVGSFGDVGTWSFCQDKIITTGGEGGMVAMNDEALWRRVWALKDIGRSYEAVYEREHPPGFRWLHESFGTNARGTEMQAAIGRIQYRRLEQWRAERTANAHVLARGLAAIPGLRVPMPGEGLTHAYYRLYAYLDVDSLPPGWSRDRIVAEVSERSDVPVFSGSCSEVYREKTFIDAGLAPEEPLPNAARLGEESLAFLVHPGMTTDDSQTVREVLEKALHSG